MQLVGTCRLTIEPHVFDARIYLVKDPTTVNHSHKQSFPAHRPVMQYGPPNGVVVTPPLPFYSAHQSPYQQAPSRPTPPPQHQQSSSTIDRQSRTLPPPHPSPTHQSPRDPQHLPNHPSPPSQSQTNTGDHVQGNSVANWAPESFEKAEKNVSGGSIYVNGVADQSATKDNGGPGLSEPRQDPVIHMLAKKASSDPQLTSLMKTVASGQATEQQLKVFQSYIDELSAIHAKQKEEESRNSKSSTAPPTASQPPVLSPAPLPTGNETREKSTPNGTPRPAAAVSSPYPPSGPVSVHPHHSTSSLGQTQAYSQSNPPFSKVKTIASPRSSDARDIAIEFEKNGDRFLFPRYSILEYVPNCNVVIASFLIVRRGSTSSSSNLNTKSRTQASPRNKVESKSDTGAGSVSHPKRDSRSELKTTSTPNSSKAESKGDTVADVDSPIYDPALDYYQPVTVRFSSSDPKVLSVLRQAVAPQEEVRRYMDDVMDKMSRAEYVYLAMRLPHSVDEDVDEVDGVAEEGTPSMRGLGESAGRGKKVARIE